MPMDVEMGPQFDLLSDQGFANALFQVANLEPGSAHMSAPVCSTFVWMISGSNTVSFAFTRKSTMGIFACGMLISFVFLWNSIIYTYISYFFKNILIYLDII